MKRRTVLTLTTTALLCAGVVFNVSPASSQQKSLKEQLIGSWIVVSVDNTAQDGSKQQIFGPSPKGILILDASGQFAQIIVRPDVPKFKSNNRLQGTPEENKAAVQGTTATFGTWTVDEASKTMTARYVGGMFPNQAGTDSKRTFSVTGDELRITNPATAAGMRSDNVWRRAK